MAYRCLGCGIPLKAGVKHWNCPGAKRKGVKLTEEEIERAQKIEAVKEILTRAKKESDRRLAEFEPKCTCCHCPLHSPFTI